MKKIYKLDNVKPSKKNRTPFLIKLFNWEYWNSNIVNAPIFFYWIYLSIRAKSFFFFNAANPKIENGGFVLESKNDIYAQMPPIFYPKTILIPINTNANEIEQKIIYSNINFPLIVKPDIGGKGRGVKKVFSVAEAIQYIILANFPILVQELIDYKFEVGIFYYRYPWQTNGQISGIVSKDFITIMGDGKSSIEELLLQNDRYVLQIDALKKIEEINLLEVLPALKEKVLVAIGNHARGSKFVDFSNRITKSLEITIDAICKQVPEFYFGRLDIMYNNWTDLEQGKNFSIIELNGAGSEPTHIYDPSHSIFFAWLEIARHQKIMWKIAMYNHRYNNIPFINFKSGCKILKQLKLIDAQLDKLI